MGCHASIVLENGKMIDCLIDPPENSSFYPPDTSSELGWKGK